MRKSTGNILLYPYGTVGTLDFSLANRVLGEVDFHYFHLSRTTTLIVSLPANWTEKAGRGVLHKTAPLPKSHNFRLQPAGHYDFKNPSS